MRRQSWQARRNAGACFHKRACGEALAAHRLVIAAPSGKSSTLLKPDGF
jgi:hypothetical protein